MSSLNNIGSSGPGTIKLPKNISAEAHAHYTFYFKVWKAVQHQYKTLKTQMNCPEFPSPITSYKQLRCRIQNTQLNTTYTPSTSEGTSLQTKLQNECKKSLRLKRLFLHLQDSISSTQKHSKQHKTAHRKRKPKKRHYSSSSTSSESNNSNSGSESSDY